MTPRIVLAYAGGVRGSAAIGWLRERYRADVIALTVDVGQERDLEEIRERALTLGAVRAHVLDRRETFAIAALAALRAAAGTPLSAATIASLAAPVLAQTVAEVASIEQATMVAHAAGHGADALDAALAGHDRMPVVRVVREWNAAGVDDAHPGASGIAVPMPTARWSASRHLLCRPVADAAEPADGCSVVVAFADGAPVAVNGVALPAAELLECLSLLAGRQRVGRLDGLDAPAATVLHAAYGVLRHPNGAVRVTLQQGSCTAAALEPILIR